MGGAALVGGLSGNALQGGVNSGPAYSGADGQQSTGTGDKNFNFGNPNRGLYAGGTSPVLMIGLAAAAVGVVWWISKKK
ncbi:MAG: hypothetical protein HRT34_09720 [Alcanivorax sp.]|nr:hypothetical protein [Alcanivorax sp.]